MSKNKPARRPHLANEGLGGRFSYFLARALTNIRQNVFVNIVTVGTITLALLIISLFLLVYVNLEGVAADWSRKVQITAYFDRELAPAEIGDFRRKIESIEGVDRVSYVSKEDAAKRFRERLKGQEALLEGVSVETLPSSMEISLKRESRSSELVEACASKIRAIPGIQDLQYGAEWVRRFSAFMNFMRLLGAVLGSFLVLSATFIVSNTIKLTIYARKDELDVLGLVGATRFFIKAPFLIEGTLQGAAGGLLAIVLLVGCYFGFLYNSGNFLSFDPGKAGISFLSPLQVLGVFGGGIFLGFLGSATSLKRFITI